eukprot:CAMPEP_0182847432 /NCGR_PEP_ID=MMETSP0006_2-20121128/28457_1 /TAXON_ID=97485 /ORGANISM="Prymnesium parvum, Strain Texoma1" /LENGTH=36 /DNA_ID= /DNA_START= /DNA_END= /DNA_ORIENTATION=
MRGANSLYSMTPEASSSMYAITMATSRWLKRTGSFP